MKLEQAERIAQGIKETLSPHCQKIQVVGSVRRKRPSVRDIDIVLLPKEGQELVLDSLICGLGRIEASGPRIKRIRLPEGISVDLYMATPSTWGTLVLIRTGSAANNVRLASLAKERGWHLAANGDGLFNEEGNRIAGDTEASIYEALNLSYQQPHERG